MIDPDPVPRPGLFTNGDSDAWTEQVLLLRTVLRMPFWQIAAIDYGILPEHLEDELIPTALTIDRLAISVFETSENTSSSDAATHRAPSQTIPKASEQLLAQEHPKAVNSEGHWYNPVSRAPISSNVCRA